MTRNERKRAAKAKHYAIESASLQAIAIEAAKAAEVKAREERISLYPTATIWSSRGQDKVIRSRIGGVIRRGGTAQYVQKLAPLPVERPKLEGEALRLALQTGTIGEKVKRPLGKPRKR